METIDEEGMKEQLAEEMAKYEEEGYFKRLGKMFSGLGKSHASREYKEAIIELQRQIAPLLAILVPLVGAAILFVVTAMGGSSEQKVKVEIAQVEKEEQLDEPEPPPETEPTPDTDVDVQMDSPNVSPVEVAEVVPPTAEPQSVKVASVDAMRNIKSPVTMKSVAGTARNAGVRGRYTSGGAQYGDANTERAVMKALRWLKLHQNSDGSWPGVKPASTGLAILTYLAHGETPSSPEFGKTVERGLEFLIECIRVNKEGKATMAGSDGNEYAFLIGTYALCEAYGMTKNPNARAAAEKTLQRIIKGQSSTGGWDYKINRHSNRDDMSFAGWALQAIKAGKMAGIHLDGMDECIKKAIKCLQTRNFKNGGFNYVAGGNPTGLTATGCLAMQLLGYSNTKEVKEALDFMRDWKPSFDPKDLPKGKSEKNAGSCPQYYCYYAAQCKYQAGMAKNAASGNLALWKKWNAEMKALYPSTIIDDKNKDGTPVTVKDVKGKDQPVGHWVNKDAHTTRPVMDTCLAALQLMVYYRYLPTTQLKATEVEKDVESLSKDKSGEINVTIDI